MCSFCCPNLSEVSINTICGRGAAARGPRMTVWLGVIQYREGEWDCGEANGRNAYVYTTCSHIRAVHRVIMVAHALTYSNWFVFIDTSARCFILFPSLPSPNTVVYCVVWPGPAPKAKRTQIAETESPLLTGRPGCSCCSLRWLSKPMGTVGWVPKLCVHECVCVCVWAARSMHFPFDHPQKNFFWTAHAGADMAPQCNFMSTGKGICLTFNSPKSPLLYPNALFPTCSNGAACGRRPQKRMMELPLSL